MNCENNFDKLIDFINEHPKDFEDKLKKFYAISTKICPYNPNWYMFKYSQFESDFTNPIVRAARGSVLEIKDGKVVRPICLPFYKFNNYGQEGCDEVDWDNAEVQLKVDGSLIKVSMIDNRPYIFTNGAWADQEIEPTGLAGEEPETDSCKTYRDFVNYCFSQQSTEWLCDVPNNTTMLFELCSPKARIIVKYDKTKLWFLGARNNISQKEYNREEFKKKYYIPFEVPPTFPIKTLEDLDAELSKWEGDKEGVVVCDKNYRRIKIKTDAYKRLKFIKGEGNFSEKAVLESIIEGTDDDAIAAYPELKDFITSMKEKVKNRVDEKLKMWKVCKAMQDELEQEKDVKEARKDFYFWAKEKFSPEDLKIVLLKGDENAIKDYILKSTTLENL